MNDLHCLSRSLSRIGAGVLLLALLACLAPGQASAAPALAGPLPLPDLLIYGTVTDDNGDPLDAGTVRAVVRGQTIATAEIGEIAGTGYTYLLVVPMGMLAPGETESPVGVALAEDALSFFVDNQPAYYQDSLSSLTVSQLRVAKDAAGGGLVLDLNLPGAMRYSVGDVNANGARNAADALLTLKYDIGLIIGVTAFPPGPNTVYLPLCDIVENGRCDSSDALRILQCDVGMTGITCPVDAIPALARSTQAPAPGAATTLHIAASAGADPATVDVRVLLDNRAAQFGAASLELRYDPALFAPLGCTETGAGTMDLVACNATFAPGAVRFNAISSAGTVLAVTLVEARFQRLGATGPDLAAHFALAADGVTDPDGNDLPWSTGTLNASATPAIHSLYLPTVAGQSGQGAATAENGAQAALTPDATPVLPLSPQVDATPAAPAQQESNSGQSIYLPAVSSQQGTASGANADLTNDIDPPAPDASTADAPAPDPTGLPVLPMPAPTTTPVAVLPPNQELVDEAGNSLIVPLSNGE